MTRTEIEREALNLPPAERAALIHSLRASLGPEESPTTAQKDERERLQGILEPQLRSVFQGEVVEATDAWWEDLLTREPTEEELDRPLGLAVPPEWSGRTLRELRAAKK